MTDEAIRALVRSALDAEYRPAPALPAGIRQAVLARPAAAWRRWSPALAGLAVLVMAAGAVSLVVWGRAALAPATRPFTAPGPLTDPAAQVAWVPAHPTIGVTSDGRKLALVDASDFNLYLRPRTADGRHLVSFTGTSVRVYDAGTGAMRSEIPRPPATVVSDASSPDGRYLALVTGDRVELYDLDAGKLASQVAVPGATYVDFHPDDVVPELFVVSNVDTAPQLTVFGYAHGSLSLIASRAAGMPPCVDRAPLTSHVAADGRTLALWCHDSGSLSLVDTRFQRPTRVIKPGQPNPFWFAPIYSPDGGMVYFHNQFSEAIIPVDLQTGKVGPAAKITVPASLVQKVGQLLVTDAEAGGIADTQPISPDGAFLYMPEDGGLAVFSTRTMATVQVLLYGHKVTDTWVSGDGSRIFAIADGRVWILAPGQAPVDTGVGGDGFLASAGG